MAIVRGKVAAPKFPEEVQNAVRNVMELQAVATFVDELAKEARRDVERVLETSEEVTLVWGETLDVPNAGKLCTFDRANKRVDRDILAQLVADGKISIDDVLDACSVNASKIAELAKGVEGAEGLVVAGEPTPVMQFRASTALKTELKSAIDSNENAGDVIRSIFAGHVAAKKAA